MATISFSGIASGIDGDAIIKATLEARRIAQLPLKNKIAENANETAALEEFNTKLLALKSALSEFSSLQGGTLTKTASTSDESAISATISGTALSSSLSLEVEQLAKNATFSFDDRFADADTAIAPQLSGSTTLSFTIGLGDEAETFEVSVDNTTTLRSLAQKISEASSGKLSASVVNAGTESNPQYLLLVSGLETGSAAGTLSVNVGSELQSAGVFQSYQLQQATDAILNVEGIGQVIRDNNKVTDIIPGVTLDLKKAGTGSIQLNIRSDVEKSAEKVAAIIEKYNEVVAYSKENNKITSTEDESGNLTNKFGTLTHTKVDDQAIDAFRSLLSSTKNSANSATVKIFADLGITTARDGTLEFDQEKFIEAANKEPASAENLLSTFAEELTKTGGVIDSYTGYNRAIDLAIRSNESSTSALNKRLQRMEEIVERESETMKMIFANLEQTIAGLNSEAQAITAMLSQTSTN